MATVTTATDIYSISGRLSKRDNVVYALNKQTGKMHRYDYYGCTQPNSADQQKVKAAFKQRAKAASLWWDANKPSKTDATRTNGTDLYQLIVKRYKSQYDIGNPWSYFLSLVDEDLKVTIGTTVIQLSTSDDDTDDSGSGSDTPTSGGTDFGE